VQDQRTSATPATSLDHRNETVHGPLCPRKPSTLIVRVDDPSICFWSGCKSYGCEVCGPRKVRGVTLAVAWQQTRVPLTRLVTLTQAPEDWQKRRQRMRTMSLWVRNKGYSWNVAWTTEKGSETGMVHIHAIQYGSFVPQAELQDRWGSIVDIRAIKNSGQAAAGYLTKESRAAVNYVAKEGSKSYMQWAQLNGGRPMHFSRGYFGSYGIEEAKKQARAHYSRGEQHEWRVATDSEAWAEHCRMVAAE